MWTTEYSKQTGSVFFLLMPCILVSLSHWGRVTHIYCVSKLMITGSKNGLSPSQHGAIIWTNAVIPLIRTLGTKFSQILRKIHTFSFKKMHLKMSSAKLHQICLSLNVLSHHQQWYWICKRGRQAPVLHESKLAEWKNVSKQALNFVLSC